jgi:hypothetical protein
MLFPITADQIRDITVYFDNRLVVLGVSCLKGMFSKSLPNGSYLA